MHQTNSNKIATPAIIHPSMYDTTTERYEHLQGLSEDEIKLVMALADIITDNIQRELDAKKGAK